MLSVRETAKIEPADETRSKGPEGHLFAALLRRDRFAILAGLVGVADKSWAYLLIGAAEMADMSDADRAVVRLGPWSVSDVVLTFLIWAVMMVAMTVPSVIPTLLLCAMVVRRIGPGDRERLIVSAFVRGYVIALRAFSLGATALQLTLAQAAPLSPMLMSSGPCWAAPCNFMRTLALLKEAEHWSLTTLREKLFKIGAKVAAHGRYVTSQVAEVAVPRNLLPETLLRIDEL